MPTVALFVHSTGTSPAMWKPLLDTVPEGIAALAPPNLGYSPEAPLPELGVSDFRLAHEVAHLQRQLPADTDAVHLVAHSYGAAVALLLARAWQQEGGPRVASLWLYEPTPFAALRALPPASFPDDVQAQLRTLYGPGTPLTDGSLIGQDAWLQAFIDYWNGAGTWQAVPERVRVGARQLGHKMFHEVSALSNHAPSFEAMQVHAPMTLVHGEHTQPPARQMVHSLHAVHPQAQVDVMQGLGHMGVMGGPEPVRHSLQAHWGRCLG